MTKRLGVTAALLALTWLLWSGYYTPLLLMLGLFSCALVCWLAVRIGFFSREVYALHLGPRLPRYWSWLLRDIVRGNLAVARIVLTPRLPINPTVIRIDAHDLSPATQATFANSVTLTPGTLTTDIHRGLVEVHCLTPDFAADLEGGELLRRARRLDHE